MNEQLTQKLLEYLNGTEAFLTAQVPDFIQQYLTWCYYESLFWLLFPLVVFLVFSGLALKLYTSDWYDDEPTPRAVFFILSIIISAIFLLANFITLPENSLKLLKITKAPKVFLVEQAANLIKK